MQPSLGERPLRVGSVPYLVGRPLDLGLEDEDGVHYERRVPAELVQGLRAGELDVALVSSIELFRAPGYRYLAPFAVSGDGPVGSVQVFLRKPIEAVRTLALDPASRAAATLVRVLLANHAPEYIEVPPGADPRETPCDAWLRIGDAALREHLEPDAPHVFNPSAEWTRRTGLPFVFAAWIVREGVPIEDHLAAFARARARGRAAIADLAVEASTAWRVPRAACEHYLAHECQYEPGERLRPALLAFRDAAARLGLCRPDLAPTAVELPHVP
ncbi:MAG: menaquinone biosynthesis protein [Planctomycetes bacterium]|nr:menaquinone biosynthesis protein [Planctomycetota bacterium]